MSTPAENLPGQQSATPPPPPPSTTGDDREKTATPPAQTATPPETLADDLDADEKEYQTKHGDNWAIKAFREEKTKSAKYKEIREVADRIGNPAIVKAGLQAVDALADPTVPIGEAKAELLAFDEDRYYELRNDFYGEFIDRYPDQVASDILGEKTTVKDVKAALAAAKGGASKQTASTKVAAFKVPDDLKDDYPEVAEMLETLQAQLAGTSAGEKPDEAADKGKADELQKQLDNLKTEKQREDYLQEVQAQGAQLYDEVFSEVDTVMQELGLAPDKDDPEDLASLKEAARDYLGDRSRVEKQFDAAEENVKLANRITEHLARKQFKRAKEYMPAAKIAARAAVEALAEDRKGKALVDAVKRELQALAKSGKTKSGGKAPLLGGTPPGAPPPTFQHGKGDDDLWDQMEAKVRERKANQR